MALTDTIIWQAVGVMIAAMGLAVTLLGFYVRSLIDRHTLNCPYPAKFAEELKKLANREVALESKLNTHIEYHLERKP